MQTNEEIKAILKKEMQLYKESKEELLRTFKNDDPFEQEINRLAVNYHETRIRLFLGYSEFIDKLQKKYEVD